MIPTSRNFGTFQQLLAASTSARSQMQSVMLVRSHHKHTHLVGRSLPVDFFLLLFLIHSSVVTPKQKVTARASGYTICSLCQSSKIPWESFELHSLRHRSTSRFSLNFRNPLNLFYPHHMTLGQAWMCAKPLGYFLLWQANGFSCSTHHLSWFPKSCLVAQFQSAIVMLHCAHHLQR